MRKRRHWLTPAGTDAKGEAMVILLCLFLSALWSLQGPAAIVREWSEAAEKLLRGETAWVTAYPGILGTALFGFYLTAAGMIGLVVWHYVYHRLGSRADYLMKRIPNGLERHVRCLAVPAAGAVVSLIAAGMLWLLYRAVYLYWHDLTYARLEGLI